jgi:nicotinamide-nucleotide amidase
LEELREELEEQVRKIETALGVYIFGVNEESLEVALGNLLREKQMTITTAESCTGGNIARKITSVAGCSDYFPGSLVAYSNRIKEKQLGVKIETLEQFGAVSEQCVLEMAKGAQQLFETDCAIAVSGIAGPGGGTPTKPVGTIWIAIANREQIYTKKLQLGTNRLQNITRTSNIAMNLMRLSLIDALSDEI